MVEEGRNDKISILGPEGLWVEKEVLALGMVNETTKHHGEPVAIVHTCLRHRRMCWEWEGVGVVNDQAHVDTGLELLACWHC